jgi:hypothetical protein
VNLRHNISFEVTELQFLAIRYKFPFAVARRIDREGKYWCKIWAMRYKERIMDLLKK